MKFECVLSVLCLASYVIASEPADIDQAYKKELAKVKESGKQTVKEGKKTRITDPARAKKTKPTVAKKKTMERERKTKKSWKKSGAAAYKKEVKQEAGQEAQETERVARRAKDMRTLERKTVKVGDEFVISRPASPNFGRTWKLHKALPAHIEMIGREKFIPAERPGKNEGTLVFTFKALKPGSVSIEFEKVYPPELRDRKPVKVRIVPVDILEAEVK
jgi:predicted secreted protein